MQFHVDPDKASQLNLRSGIKPATILAVLPAETNVTKISEHPSDSVWWVVNADLNGDTVQGHVHSSYLKPGHVEDVTPVLSGDYPEAHMKMNGKSRSMDGGRAFPLDEASMPLRTSNSASELVKIINFLEPDNASHKRYIATGGKTFCNIYAYDYACRCSVYLPRVWWTDKALIAIAQGQHVDVKYAKTVRELNANMLHDWFIDYGNTFGWKRVFEPSDLQSAANGGRVAIIVAKRVNLSRSGHIVAVVPEHDGITAGKKSGTITRPVQSQAGHTNFKAKPSSKIWWDDARFQSFGFWVHD
ncbi:hypothetical protein [Ruegeria sp. HKCCD6119]|uniref:hypothetical protein n=1 Tax=Ruegeria sp. HKCCD6119 TaxID=2683003 RepID=UPI0014915751|nr:hypothetical protein [Ruegeria sp. HKCCD6119]NOD84031.1 hypothetical protein [Ruegeria sp. HKCCD6119]